MTGLHVDGNTSPHHLPAFGMIALAASAGGWAALSQVLSGLPKDFPVPIAIVQHLDPRHRSLMAELLSRRTSLSVKQAEDGEQMCG